MPVSTFLDEQLREELREEKLIEFASGLPEGILNIEDKTRSNSFTWRGQFSPQLIENLLLSYCPKNAKILDPFAGSGTVLYESACLGLQAFGCDINPAAWILSRTYELTNLELKSREALIRVVMQKLQANFPKYKNAERIELKPINLIEFGKKLGRMSEDTEYEEKIILDTLVILLDLPNNKLTPRHIDSTFDKLCHIIREFPYSEAPIATLLCDARCLTIETDSIDFVVTSPPYINVFNYHQNYRGSAELLGWELLKIAKSEIGSNRANRGNRFLTVIQYCLDMALVLQELQRVCKPNARIILVVGYESNVLGVPFYNADIISELATKTNLFELAITQKRIFKNKFGKKIREYILNLTNNNFSLSASELDEIARNIADRVLRTGLSVVSEKNKFALIQAIEKVQYLCKSPMYNHQTGTDRQKNYTNGSFTNATLR